MNKLTRCGLTNNLRDKFPQLSAKQVDAAVSAVFAQIRASLISGKGMEIRSFGALSVRRKSSRKGRNPRTDGELQVPAKRKLHFKSSLLLRKMLNPLPKATEKTLKTTKKKTKSNG